MNHAAAHQANAKPLYLIHVVLWVGFISVYPIHAGEEEVWDYGAPVEGNEWRMKPTPSAKVGTGLELILGNEQVSSEVLLYYNAGRLCC